jgi:hypothetical protein
MEEGVTITKEAAGRKVQKYRGVVSACTSLARYGFS